MSETLASLSEGLAALLGLDLDVSDVDVGQMVLRTVFIYVASLILVRLASRRFLSQASPFDVIVAIMLGSIMSRAINGSAPFLPTIAAGLALVALHWIVAAVTARAPFLGSLVKGTTRVLIDDGEVKEDALLKSKLSRKDLEEAMRSAGASDPAKVERAVLERGGSISVITYPAEPRILETRVENGVQTVRIELSSGSS